MPPPRRREAALAPLRGATLAPACWNSAVGTRGCLSHFSQMALTLPKSVFPAAGLCHPSLVWCQPLTTLHCWGHTGMAPKDKQQQGAGSRAGRRRPPSGAGKLPKPTDTNAQALGREEEAATQQLPALQLSACSGPEVVPGAVSSAAGMGWGHPGRCKGTVLAVHSSSSAVALRSCQLCLMDNKDHATAGS